MRNRSASASSPPSTSFLDDGIDAQLFCDLQSPMADKSYIMLDQPGRELFHPSIELFIDSRSSLSSPSIEILYIVCERPPSLKASPNFSSLFFI